VPAILEADDLHAQYGSTVVLHGLRFAVEAGGITTILGANGAGKTTTLRAVCAMVKTSGEVRFDGQRIDGKTTENIVRLGIAHTPEGRGTFVDLTVEENLRLGAYARRDRSGLEGAYEKVYQHFPVLAERRRQQAGTLSGGEQQMLAVARALMSRPKMLLLDEPSLGLAPMVTQELFKRFSDLNSDFGTTMFLVEQNAGLALAIAARAYVLEAGHIVLSGSSEDLRDHDDVRKAYLGF
jgi:branched-chain amino acid transport system ATP-binding protein